LQTFEIFGRLYVINDLYPFFSHTHGISAQSVA